MALVGATPFVSYAGWSGMGSGCAGQLSVLPFVRLCFGQNEAVRCIGHRSALHPASQRIAQAIAARCVICADSVHAFFPATA